MASFRVRQRPVESPARVSDRWRRRLDAELMLQAVSGPVGTVLGPPVLFSILLGWTADLGRCYGFDPGREDHRLLLRDTLGHALWRRWRAYRGAQPGPLGMGIKAARALLLGQDAGWVAHVMTDVDQMLQGLDPVPHPPRQD
ncbi:MAG: hypothetical protein ACP5QO_01340 [Clostridia bacterium]